MIKNQASQVVGAQLVLQSNGKAFTGTARVAITADGGTQNTTPGGTVTHEGRGFHTYTPTQAETNADHLAFTFDDAGDTAIPVTVQIYTTQDLATTLATVAANVALILADTNELQTDWTNGGRLDLIIDALALQATLSDVSGRIPAALTAGGRMSSDAIAVSGSTVAADRLEDAAEVIAFGTAAAGTLSTTEMTTDLTIVNASQYLGRKLYFKEDTTTAALRGVAKEITSVTVSGAKLGFAALPTAPVAGDTFVITG